MTINTFRNMTPRQTLLWLANEYTCELPESAVSCEDMEEIAQLMLKLSGKFFFLNAALSWAKVLTREEKRAGNKEGYEDMVDKKEAIENYAKAIAQNYQALSRLVTIRQDNLKELNFK